MTSPSQNLLENDPEPDLLENDPVLLRAAETVDIVLVGHQLHGYGAQIARP